MADLVNGLEIRKRLGREWGVPHPFGEDGFRYTRTTDSAKIIATGWYQEDPVLHATAGWLHASISRPVGLPGYEDLVLLHHAVWGDTGHAYQVFVPPIEHINIHPRALHLWGRADGTRVLPNFAVFGSI